MRLLFESDGDPFQNLQSLVGIICLSIIIFIFVVASIRECWNRRLAQQLRPTRVKKAIDVRKVTKINNRSSSRQQECLDDSQKSFNSQICLGNDDNDVCQICLSSFKVGEEIASSRNPKCLHEFHSQCIIEWLSRPNQTSCPVCRAEYVTIATDRTSDSISATV